MVIYFFFKDISSLSALFSHIKSIFLEQVLLMYSSKPVGFFFFFKINNHMWKYIAILLYKEGVEGP